MNQQECIVQAVQLLLDMGWNKDKELERIEKLHRIYSSFAVLTNNNMPPDSYSGFIGWIESLIN